jgi:predicted Fe-S protein YdhL (DUF1289 family)
VVLELLVMTEHLPPSPCLGICIMDPRTRQCRGCLRTVEEIAAWYEATAAEKRALIAVLDARRAAAEGKRAAEHD